MFVIVSRALWVLFSPANFLVFLTLAGVAALFTRFARAGRRALVVAVGITVFCGFGPIGAILVRPLEDRFPAPPASMSSPTGIIVLGGALNAQMSDARGVTALSESGRMTSAAILALRYPSARIVFSGGPGDSRVPARDESHIAQGFLTSLGIEVGRIVLESRSLNTDQNANFTRDLVHPQPGQTWLLITSAAHMPRAMGAFRSAGFDVVAYPTDFLTLGYVSDYWTFRTDPIDGLLVLNIAMHEWLGLVAYRLAGKAEAFLPGP